MAGLAEILTGRYIESAHRKKGFFVERIRMPKASLPGIEDTNYDLEENLGFIGDLKSSLANTQLRADIFDHMQDFYFRCFTRNTSVQVDEALVWLEKTGYEHNPVDLIPTDLLEGSRQVDWWEDEPLIGFTERWFNRGFPVAYFFREIKPLPTFGCITIYSAIEGELRHPIHDLMVEQNFDMSHLEKVDLTELPKITMRDALIGVIVIEWEKKRDDKMRV